MKPLQKITTIIFSKNRACQLELLLRGMNFSATILYTCDKDFEKGYEKLIKMYPDFDFVKQYDFKKQLFEMVETSKDHILFLVDDDICLEPFDENCKEFDEFKDNEGIICLNLRLAGKYKHKGLPELDGNKWGWKQFNNAKAGHVIRDWGYPMSVTSHIFRKKDILNIIEKAKGEITTPNFFESFINKRMPDRPLMLCLDNPKFINNLANQVQDYYIIGTSNVSLEQLESGFLLGARLSIDDMKEKAKEADSCFLKHKYKWENLENNWLYYYKKNITSQRGEDGIAEKIFEVLDIKKGWCVDVGAFGKMLSNTYTLISKGWTGILIDEKQEYVDKLKRYHGRAGRKTECICKSVEPTGRNSLDNILRATKTPKYFDFLSIDIDGNDYYIWKYLKEYRPKIVLVEFNPTKEGIYIQEKDGEGGASLESLIVLGKRLGYELISSTSINAFFVVAELFYKFAIFDNSISELSNKKKETYDSNINY